MTAVRAAPFALTTIVVALTIALSSVAGRAPTTLVGVIGTIGIIVALVTMTPGRSHNASLLAVSGALLVLSDGWALLPAPVAVGLSVALPPLAIACAGLSVFARPAVAVIAAVIAAVVAGPLAGAFQDRLADPQCIGCGANGLAPWPDNTAYTLLTAAGGLALVLSLAVIAATARRERVAAAGVAVTAMTVIVPGSIDPVWSGCAAVVIAAAFLAWRRADWGRARARVVRLATRANGADIMKVLQVAAAEPQLRVVYPSAVPGAWIDPSGSPTPAPNEHSGEYVFRGGETIAMIEGPARDRVAQLLTEDVIAALADGRLSALLAADVQELGASRQRIVRRADDERRMAERNLHDGAQQYLLAFGLSLRAAAAEGGHPGAVDDAMSEVELALTELRRIAHGVYPPLLSAAGVVHAVTELARRTGAPVVVDGELPRLSTSIERTLYLVVAATLERGKATEVALTVADGCLLATIASAPSEIPDLLVERVAALGGSLLLVDDVPGSSARWEARVPCA